MDNSGFSHPTFYRKQRLAPIEQWSPNIHYAQHQKLPTGILDQRIIYDFELLYVRKGEAVTHFEDDSIVIPAGHLLLIPAGVAHRNEVRSTPNAHFIGIHFDFFHELQIIRDEDLIVNEHKIIDTKFATEAIAEGFEPLSSQRLYLPSPLCVQLIEQLVQEFTMRPPGYLLICKALLLHILGLLLRSQKSHNHMNPPVQGDRILDIMNQIELYPADHWSNARLAHELNMNEDHMIKVFKKMAGMPPGEYVQMLRHREARRLLRETNGSIEEIGRQVGYHDIHYFSRIFRKSEGIPPRAYRNLSRIL